MHGRRSSVGPVRARGGVIGILSVLTVVAAVGAATGADPAQVVSAPVRYFFPSDRPAAGAVPTTTVPPCRPAASLVERAAGVLIVGLPNVTEPTQPLVADIVDAGVAGILVTGVNVETAVQARRLISDIKARARRPMVVSTDEEPGRVTSFGHIIGYTSSARRLAREGTVEQMRALARDQATSLASMGVTLNLAPVADIDDGPYDGTIGDRSFSADPAVAARFAYAYAAGLAEAGVIPTVKHFPGRAQAAGDDHLKRITSSVSLDVLRRVDLAPFVDLIDRGAPVVMLSNVDYLALDPTAPASMSAAAYGLLRSLGFRGVAITDSIGMGAVNQRWDMAEAAVKAIQAGADGVLTTDGGFTREMVRALVDAVKAGSLPEERLNEAAGRMIALAGGDPKAFACQAVELPRLQRG